jgi:hypothetical protein
MSAWTTLKETGLDVMRVADESFAIGKAIREHVTGKSDIEIDVSTRLVALFLVAAAVAQSAGVGKRLFVGTAALAFDAADESPVPATGGDATSSSSSSRRSARATT